MSQSSNSQPFKTLGLRLKQLREQQNLSIGEVCGAIEVDPETLADIETGHKQPAEDVLLLLLSHLNTPEEEATKIWELADYDQANEPPMAGIKPIVMLVQPDSRIMYSDLVNVAVNKQGVVVNFLQDQGAGKKGTPIARVGMSRQQAQVVIASLQLALQTNPSSQLALPAPDHTNNNQDSIWLNRNKPQNEL
jgi:transcriptional regulator with XRE-family HTH domain